MYTEFIVIFVLLGIVLAVSVVNLIFLILLKKDGGAGVNRSVAPNAFQYQNNYSSANMMQNQGGMQMNQGGRGVCFCRNCATQYDVSLERCPKCGAPR